MLRLLFHLRKQALAINANYGEARLLLGGALMSLSDFQGAKTELDEFVRLNPSSPVGYQRLGSIYLQQGNFQQAELQTASALKLDPQNLDALAAMAELQVKQKNPQKAFDQLNLAIEKNPKQPKLYEILGRIHLELK